MLAGDVLHKLMLNVRGHRLPGEERTLAPPQLLLGVAAGEGAPRGRAEGSLHAEQAASKKGMVMQLAERPSWLWEVCGKHSGQIAGEARS